MEIVDAYAIIGRLEAKIIGGAVSRAALHTAAGHPNAVLNLFNDKPGLSVLVSGSSDETSKAHEGTSTMFSHWLADALGGAADLNGDRIVSAQELFSFVAENVKLESKGTQQPRFRLSKDGGVQPLAAR